MATEKDRLAAVLAADLEQRLRALGSPERAGKERAYLKSELVHFGASVPQIRAEAVRLSREREPDRTLLLALVGELWGRGVHECRVATVELLARHHEQLGRAELAMIEELLREARTWALVDGLAVSVVGPVLERHPEALAVLDRWAADDDFWIRRSALLALLPGLRRGDGDFVRFARYADAMLDEREFFIRKALGWVLRETGKHQPDKVIAWLRPRITRTSGVTVREAVKHLPAGERDALLEAYRASR